MLTDRKIGVLMGGASSEREVSLRSGASVLNALKSLGYNAVPIDAGRDICEVLRNENIGLAYLVLHGGWGEDGGIQGLLEVMGIPYTGSGVLASALAMDKAVSRVVFASAGLHVPRYELVSARTKTRAPISQGLVAPPPWVVKPRREGSSVGISIVRERGKLDEALKTALSFGGDALIEEFIEGKEVHIGLLDGRALGGVEVRPSLEFYSYEAKYTSGKTQYIVPPTLEADAYERAKEAALKAHNALGCSGATRVDLIVDARGIPYVLEVNTIPGMTETSLLPKIAGHAGLSFPALVEEILKSALRRQGQ